MAATKRSRARDDDLPAHAERTAPRADAPAKRRTGDRAADGAPRSPRRGKGRAAEGEPPERRARRRAPWPSGRAAEVEMTLKEEIAALRTRLRDEWDQNGDTKEIVRMVDALGRALKVQYGLEGRAAKGLEEALARALTEIGNELGMTL
ncbi:MAG: hypothetical protein HY691_17630 [Chloroflexi bacterium]|nr:hypothetical protein [Chloroflexota bacterium]